MMLTLGIASTEYGAMSTATKFLACGAHGDDGSASEVLVKAHIKRMLQLIYNDDEALIHEYVLKEQWLAPNCHKIGTNTEPTKKLDNNNSMEMDKYLWKMTAERNRDFKAIAQMMKPAEDAENETDGEDDKDVQDEEYGNQAKAILISQKSGCRAQAPKLFSLERDEKEPFKFRLNLFQIKSAHTLKVASSAELFVSLGALTSRTPELDAAIETSLAEVVGYDRDKDKFVRLLNEIHAAVEEADSLTVEDSIRLSELKEKKRGMPALEKGGFAQFERLSDAEQREMLKEFKASKQQNDAEILGVLNDLIELQWLSGKEALKKSFEASWDDAVKVYRSQHAIEMIRSSLEKELRKVLGRSKRCHGDNRRPLCGVQSSKPIGSEAPSFMHKRVFPTFAFSATGCEK